MDHMVTLGEAKSLIKAMAHAESLLLLSPPGLGKSAIVRAAAAEAGLECRSLLGTQIAPEDVSGVPRIEGERSVFCPPRILLPERPEPFCLFLDELPAANPEVQKAFYAVLLERRVGEYALPKGAWVVAAGNRAEDRALVRTLSSALVNRVTLLHVTLDHDEWMAWAKTAKVRPEILAFISVAPDALMRPVPAEPTPFSTPRAWAALSTALDLAQEAGVLTERARRALAFGKVSPGDAALFCALSEEALAELHPPRVYVELEAAIPEETDAKWFALRRIREAVASDALQGVDPKLVERFLQGLPPEARFTLFVGLVEKWGALGADEVMMKTLVDMAGL